MLKYVLQSTPNIYLVIQCLQEYYTNTIIRKMIQKLLVEE